MFKHSRRTLTILSVALALVACGVFALSGGALADHKPNHNPGGGGEPPPDPAIAFDAWKNYAVELMVANEDGSNQTVLVGPDNFFHFPSWSPDGLSLVFEDFNAMTDVVTLQLIDLDVIGGELQVGDPVSLVDVAGPVEGFLPAWSPQGNLIAYVKNHPMPEGIFVTDVNTGQTVQVVADPFPDDGRFDVGWPAWSPNGMYLAYTWSNWGILEFKIKIKELLFDTEGSPIDSDGDGIADGDVFEVIVTPRQSSGLDWSRGVGQFLAYKIRGRFGDPDRGMHVVELDLDFSALSDVVLAETIEADSPTWAPDSDTELVYMNRRGGNNASGSRRIVKREVFLTDQETVLVERKGFHLFWPDRRRF